MKQQRLGLRPEKTVRKQAMEYDRRNLECARLILDAPNDYGGESAFPAVWARLVIERLGSCQLQG
jgi:hypothetical protein